MLRCRNATQTSVVLEWDPIDLATADLRSLSLYRNGSKAGNIPRPLENTATKISGLAVDTEYGFHLVLRTSSGQYSSEKLVVRTHKMTDLSGITITPGVLPPPLRESLSGAIDRIGAKTADSVRIDTTHFVCTEGRGREWEKALEMNIPVVRPEWVEGCEREGRIVGVRGYYLNADPRLRQVGPGVSPLQPHSISALPSRTHGESQSNLHQQQRPSPLSQSAPTPPLSSSKPYPSPLPRDDSAPPPPAKDTPEPLQPSVASVSDEEDPSDQLGISSQSRDVERDLKKSVLVERGEEDSRGDGGSFSEVQL